MKDSPSSVRKLSQGSTLSDQAYLALREGITEGHFVSGQRLTERALAETLGVSPTPVREALQRLEHERLIERDAVRSIRVADPSPSRLYELALIEASLRAVAARLAAERGTESETDAIAKACDRAEALAEEPDLERRATDLLSLTREFHALVDRASHNRTLLDMISTASAFDMAFRIKWISHVHTDRDSLRASLAQHRVVADAIRRRDGDVAEQAMREHSTQRLMVYRDLVDPSNSAEDRIED